MIKNVLPSLRQRAGPQRICSRQKSIHSGTARDSFSQTPHMRGKDCNGKGTGAAPGITPAYAGKSARCICACTWDRDHPRVCGEKHAVPHDAADGLRITPACAGKSFIVLSEGMIFRDHPRVCGEKDITALNANNWQGSPPHMRGKGAVCAAGLNDLRITPAYAGKSTPCRRC